MDPFYQDVADKPPGRLPGEPAHVQRTYPKHPCNRLREGDNRSWQGSVAEPT